jgi:hypothetical protein
MIYYNSSRWMMACCLVLTYRHRKSFRIREKETRAGRSPHGRIPCADRGPSPPHHAAGDLASC